MSNVVSFRIYSQTSTQLLPCHCQPNPSMSNDFILNFNTISNLIPSLLDCQIVTTFFKKWISDLFNKVPLHLQSRFFTGKKRQHQRLSKFEQINLSLNFGHLVLQLGYFCIFSLLHIYACDGAFSKVLQPAHWWWWIQLRRSQKKDNSEGRGLQIITFPIFKRNNLIILIQS